MVIDAVYVRGEQPTTSPSSKLISRMHAGLRSVVSSMSLSTAQLSNASAVTSAYTATGQPGFDFADSLHPHRLVATPISLLLILILSVLGFSIVRNRRANGRRTWRSIDYLEHNIVATEVTVTKVGLRGEEQSPVPSKQVPGDALNGLEPVSSIIIHQANIVHDTPISASPPPSRIQGHPILLSDSPGSQSSGCGVKEFKIYSSPSLGGTIDRPIVISDSPTSESSRHQEKRNTFQRRVRTGQRSPLASDSPASVTSSHLWADMRFEKGSSVYYQTSLVVSPWTDSAAASESGDSDKENESRRMREPFDRSDSLEAGGREHSLLMARLEGRSIDRIKRDVSRNYKFKGTGSLHINNLHPREPLQPRATTPPSPKSSSSHRSTAESEYETTVKRWLNAVSPPSGQSMSESQNGISPNELAALLLPHAEPPRRLVLTVNPLGRGAPRAGRRAPERFADSEYSVWAKK